MEEESGASEGRWRLLMVAAQEGDADAYERLLHELVPVLRRFVASRLRGARPADCEDVVQNVLLSIHRARHTYRPERPFEPWWHAIARNAVVDFTRQRGRRWAREVELEGVEELADPSPETVPGRELAPELARALEELPAAQREAVELLQVEGLSVAEAAQKAGVSRAALKVRAHRGYRALRDKLRRRSE